MAAIVIAGVRSGVGKTTIATGIMGALTRRGYQVQPFKAGPDYIDPSYHQLACGVPSRNLDTWLLPHPTVTELFQRASSQGQISIVEGVMGVFDGHSSLSEEGSTAELAKLLNAPVILVADAGKVARSVAAEVLGYQQFDPDLNIAGVILNGVGGPRHLEFCQPLNPQLNLAAVFLQHTHEQVVAGLVGLRLLRFTHINSQHRFLVLVHEYV